MDDEILRAYKYLKDKFPFHYNMISIREDMIEIRTEYRNHGLARCVSLRDFYDSTINLLMHHIDIMDGLWLYDRRKDVIQDEGSS